MGRPLRSSFNGRDAPTLGNSISPAHVEMANTERNGDEFVTTHRSRTKSYRTERTRREGSKKENSSIRRRRLNVTPRVKQTNLKVLTGSSRVAHGRKLPLPNPFSDANLTSTGVSECVRSQEEECAKISSSETPVQSKV